MTYAELGDGVQERSGIRTRVLLPNWIGKLLEAVAILAKTNDEPPLTSLAVHQDGTIGTGYAWAPKSIAYSPGDDIEYYAAEHRLLCYRRYEAVGLPADGGEPALTKAVSERRARKAPAPLARTDTKSGTTPTSPGCFQGQPPVRLIAPTNWRPSTAKPPRTAPLH